jgi:hypothetical protein
MQANNKIIHSKSFDMKIIAKGCAARNNKYMFQQSGFNPAS